MPYTYITKKLGKKKKYCMKSKESGKTYCSDTLEKRKRVQRLHEYYKNRSK